MIKRLVIYAVGIYILGLVLSGVTYWILDFSPYFVAGMVLTTPIYGAVRKRTGKGQIMSVGISKLTKGFKGLLKINKKSITFYLVALIVVSRSHDILAEIIGQSLVVGISTFVIAFATWEVARFIARKTKKVQFLSFGDAVKGAF